MGGIEELAAAAGQVGGSAYLPIEDPEEARQEQHNTSVNEPKVGSFEAFMASFGSPQRWAGR